MLLVLYKLFKIKFSTKIIHPSDNELPSHIQIYGKKVIVIDSFVYRQRRIHSENKTSIQAKCYCCY